MNKQYQEKSLDATNLKTDLMDYDAQNTTHDFLTERKALLLFAGQTMVRAPKSLYYLNLVYVVFITCVLSYLEVMSLLAIYVSLGDIVLAIHSFHLFLLVTVTVSSLLTVLANGSSLVEARRMIRSGVYSYDEEGLPKEAMDIRREGVEEIRRMGRLFARFLCFSATSNTVYVSLSQYLLISEDTSSCPLNPYLPQPIYMPFPTRTPGGFVLGFLIVIVYMAYLCAAVISMDQMFCSCTVQLRDQFRILNQSLLSIQSRAIRKHGNHRNLPVRELYKTKEFQECLYECLRRNVLHHQAIIRFKKSINGYTGASFLIVVALASVIFAAHLVLILENIGWNIKVNFIVTLTAELMYALHYCWYGEEVANESSKVYHSLYSTPWVHFDSRCKKVILIMMMNNKNPMKIKTSIFNISASLETFGNIISTMYQIMNVLRNKK